jgi:hypothetical protein
MIDSQLRRRPVEACAKVLWIGLTDFPLAQPNFVVGKEERDILAFLNSCSRNTGGKGEGDRFTVHVGVQLRNWVFAVAVGVGSDPECTPRHVTGVQNP